MLPTFPDTQIIPWENLDSPQKHCIKRGISGDTPPMYLIYPHHSDSLSHVMTYAHQEGLSVLPCGNGSKLSWGNLVNSPQWVISTQRLNRIIEHSVGDLTLTVEAGAKLVDIQAILEQYNQFLPLNPTYSQEATIGGIVATADAGSWRQRYGGVRDLILGISFVRFDGKVAKAGGKVVKNVAGYDLMKLFTGSYGTLGIISQVTFRLYPLPEASATIAIIGETEAIAAFTQSLRQSGLTPVAAEMITASVSERLSIGKGMGVLLQFKSIKASVDEQISQVKVLTQNLSLSIHCYQQEEEKTLWEQFSKTIMGETNLDKILCKIGIIPSEAVTLWQQWEKLTENQGMGSINLGSGIGKLRLETEEGEKTQAMREMRSHCQTHRGFLTILEGSFSLKQALEPWGYEENVLEIMQKIKQNFDPQLRLSPGRF